MNKPYRQLAGLLILSCILSFTGVALAFIHAQIGFICVICLVAGTVSWFLFIVARRREDKQMFFFDVLKQDLDTVLKAFILLTAVVVLNMIVVDHNVFFDATRFKQHTLNASTLNLLKNLKQDIKITVFHIDLPPKYLEDLLKEYERQGGGRVTTEIIDPLVQIGYAAQFGNVINGKETKAIVQSGSERRDVDFTDKPLTEDLIDNALVRVTRKARHLYFLAGHDEYDIYNEKDKGFNKFNKLLLANNMIAQKLVLTKGSKMPVDCDLLIVAGPQKDLGDDESKIISDYLDRGGDVLFLIENIILTTPDIPLKEADINRNPSLNNILTSWGTKVATDVVVDLASHAEGDVGSPATKNYMPHKAIIQGLDYTFYVRPRSISMVAPKRPTIKYAPLVLTASSQESWGETNRQLQIKFDEGVDRGGPVPIAFVMWEPKDDKKISDTRVALFTDADFLSNVYIDELSNAQMGINIVNWLTESNYQAFVPPKDVTIAQLNLTSQQKRCVVVVLVAIPLMILLVGVLVWLRGRIE